MNAAADAAAKSLFSEEREVEHRRASAAFDEDEDRQQDDRCGEARRSRAASLQPERPPFESASTSTGEADDEGRGADEVETALLVALPDISCSTRNAHAEPSSPSGTLNQNTQCHEIAMSAPPSTGPITSPTAAIIVFVPIASPSSFFGNASVTSAAAFAKRNAPPTPCTMRQRISCVPLPEKPGAERGGREEHEAEHVGVLAAEEVGEPAGGQDEHGRDDHVDEDHPHELQQASCAGCARGRAAR